MHPSDKFKFQLMFILVFFISSSLVSCKSAREDAVKNAFMNYSGNHVIFVSKKDFTLTVYGKDLKPVKVYRAGYGQNPDRKSKIHSGDNRTPEGLYHINEILSMDANTSSPAYQKLKILNRVYFRAKEGHSKYERPGVDLGDNAYGPRFYGIDYPNESDIKRYNQRIENNEIKSVKGKVPGIGYGIAIHGNSDEFSIGKTTSNGCVRLFNNDIVELENYIIMGMPVIISAD